MVLAKRIRTLACVHTDTCALILFLNLSARIERRKPTLGEKKRQNISISIFNSVDHLTQLFSRHILSSFASDHTIE
jgi:hypothetical protein